jgi:hypothetical protein
MPRVTRRPLDEHARARLRNAQRAESDAVADVHAASINRSAAQEKLDAVIASHHVAVEDADRALSRAQAHLATVSGIERAALLLEQPVATLRAAVRTARGAAHEDPA